MKPKPIGLILNTLIAATIIGVFRCEERIECLGERRFVHAGSVIGDRYDEIAARRELRRCFPIGSTALDRDAHRAALGQRIAGVDRQVKDREFELIDVDLGRRQVRLTGDHETNFGPQRPPQQFRNVANQSGEISRSGIKRLLSSESEETLD